MLFLENVVPTLNEWLDGGQPVALVTLVGIDGSSPRPIGSQLGVAADGRAVGMITGGCAEQAIIAEAQKSIAEGRNRKVRYGAGSPYLDVVLPCGAGIDVYIETTSAEKIIRAVHDRQQARAISAMEIDLRDLSSRVSPTPDADAPADKFKKRYTPEYCILSFGEGANLIAFCAIARTAGFRVEALSPDLDALEFLTRRNIGTHHIHRQTDFSSISIDAYTAVITLFHEHEWERDILIAALNSDADYIGALGSRATHAARRQSLADAPRLARPFSDIRGPVGLDIGAQNPNEIAVSVLAEIIERRRKGVL